MYCSHRKNFAPCKLRFRNLECSFAVCNFASSHNNLIFEFVVEYKQKLMKLQKKYCFQMCNIPINHRLPLFHSLVALLQIVRSSYICRVRYASTRPSNLGEPAAFLQYSKRRHCMVNSLAAFPTIHPYSFLFRRILYQIDYLD